MWNSSHETPVQSLRRHIGAWKLRGPSGDGKKGAWSDEAICGFVAVAHAEIGGPAKTGIVFPEEGSCDEPKRLKAIAARIGRYMTEEPVTEFEAMQLLNFAPSILAAMPADLRVSFLNEYLSPVGLHVAANESSTDGEVGVPGLLEIMDKDAQSQQAYARAVQNPDDVSALHDVQRNLLDSIEVKTQQWRIVTGMIRAKSAAGSLIKKAGSAVGRAIHRKSKEVAWTSR